MESPLKIVIINKSDSTGGAAIVSRRLMEALRLLGADARMLVAEKLSDSPYVEKAASDFQIKKAFLTERLRIFIANGFNRSTLFKIDTGESGLPLWRHPLVKDADAILLNWVNQGVLSLKGVERIIESGKPVIWTMHDMWDMTGICHHSGKCVHYLHNCGNCPLLLKKASQADLSNKIWKRKNSLYSHAAAMANPIRFVAVSSWLAEKARQSSLLSSQPLEMIHNAFNLTGSEIIPHSANRDKIRILFGAARLDDPIKGADTLREMSKILASEFPQTAARLELALFGTVKNPATLEGFQIPIINLGHIEGEENIKKAYRDSQILVSASSYETLPGTLVEAQAFGAIPVAFNQGGQADIVDHLTTGFLAPFDENPAQRARNLAKGILWAVDIIGDKTKYDTMRLKMAQNVINKFSYRKIASQYLSLIRHIRQNH